MGLISEDPIGFAAGDANIVRYVENQVLDATDPSGLDNSGINGGLLRNLSTTTVWVYADGLKGDYDSYADGINDGDRNRVPDSYIRVRPGETTPINEDADFVLIPGDNEWVKIPERNGAVDITIITDDSVNHWASSPANRGGLARSRLRPWQDTWTSMLPYQSWVPPLPRPRVVSAWYFIE